MFAPDEQTGKEEVIHMPRPIKGRNVCCLPQSARFGPLGRQGVQLEEIMMTVDEYETIRLIDYLDFTQEECSRQMNVARTTVQGIYSQARKKLAHALVNGVPLAIGGGEYKLCGGWDESCGRGCCRRRGRRMAGTEDTMKDQQEEKT